MTESAGRGPVVAGGFKVPSYLDGIGWLPPPAEAAAIVMGPGPRHNTGVAIRAMPADLLTRPDDRAVGGADAPAVAAPR